ncbi:MAG: UDP-glucose/GDP-mannose dehydrogenase family protein [Clostridia bacterium]|nr:UDP-glucose/GDP-mannose dehydrogenase family protein [Clostridia bacterium]
MNISIIGTGYVGLVTGAGFADLGMNVLCMDTDEHKISQLKQCSIPIYEPLLEEIVKNNFGKNLNFTTDIKEAVEYSEIIFIAVGTPTMDDNTADLKNLYQAVRSIATHMDSYKIIVDKSTVPVGTAKCVKKEISQILYENRKNISFDVVSNPEFLREGNAVEDFFKPERIVIGSDNNAPLDIMKKLYESFISRGIPLLTTNLETAEMIKYASNAFLAAKISFINEIANMCEYCNADVGMISKAIGLDSRIGSKFLNPGPGFGGSCFPKDLKALVGIGKKIGYAPKLINSVIAVNENQKKLMFRKIKKALGSLENKNITVLGLAFKAETDDIRESPPITIIEMLIREKANVKVYDPKAMLNMKNLYRSFNIEYFEDAYSACAGTDCIVIATEWKEFSCLELQRLQQLVRTPLFIDLRNLYEPESVKKSGFIYQGVGRK